MNLFSAHAKANLLFFSGNSFKAFPAPKKLSKMVNQLMRNNCAKIVTTHFPHPIRTFQRMAFYSTLNIHDSLHLVTAYWQFGTLCIWSLTKMLRIGLKSPFSYIYRITIYVHAIHHRQKVNFSKNLSGRWEQNVKDPANRSEGVKYYPEC